MQQNSKYLRFLLVFVHRRHSFFIQFQIYNIQKNLFSILNSKTNNLNYFLIQQQLITKHKKTKLYKNPACCKQTR
jgi:hypothetical protein